MNATRETDIVEFDDKEYIVSALGLLELESLETYIQGRVMSSGRASLPDDATPEIEDRMMQPIIAYAMNLSITSNQGFSKLMNFAGLTRLIYYSLKRQHPDITLEKCRGFVMDKEVSKKFSDSIVRVNKLSRTSSEKHLSGSADKTSRQVTDTAGPESDVRDAAIGDRGIVTESVGSVSESNGRS